MTIPTSPSSSPLTPIRTSTRSPGAGSPGPISCPRRWRPGCWPRSPAARRRPIWPGRRPGGPSAATLEQLRAFGVTGVLLGSSAVTPKVDANGRLASVAHVPTARGTMTVGSTSRAISQDAGAAMGPSSASVLPDLIAEIAIRAAEKPPVPPTSS